MDPDLKTEKHSTVNQRRPIIGYMTNGVYGQGGKGSYHSTLWKGIRDSTRANGVKLICYLGGAFLTSPDFMFEFQRNQVFDLISEDQIDGLIVSSATLVSTLGYDQISQICAKYQNIPVISLGIPLDNYPYLSVDNRMGEKALIDHLIEVHGYRSIAFIRGPESNADAQERFQAYRESLADHGIPLNPDLIFPGDFARSSGEYAAQMLLEKIKSPVEAVAAANDSMALGLINVLQEKGFQVPHDIAVVGFDDIPDAKTSFPPLTTVRQHIDELGHTAVEWILNQLHGEDIDLNSTLPNELIVRNSCGCSLYAGSTTIQRNTPLLTPQAEHVNKRNDLIEMMVDSLNCPPPQRGQALNEADTLVEILEGILAGTGTSDDLAVFIASGTKKDSILPWHRAIAVYSQKKIELVNGRPQNSPTEAGWQLHRQITSAWQRIWQATCEVAWFSQSVESSRELYLQEIQLELFRRVSQGLVTSFDLSILMDTAWRTLPLLGMRGCWIALFDETGGDKQRVRLRLAYDQDGRTDLSDQGRIFPVDMLLPDEILGANRTFDLIVNSLYFGDTCFGYIIFEIDQPDQKIIEMITSQVGTALQGAKVVNEIQNMQAEFHRQANTDPLTEIYNRRALYTLAEPCFQLARRHNLPFSVAMIDLDNFKRVNDVYGHSVGDQLLHDLSAFIKEQIRGSDIFGRFGGEEFLLILPQTPLDRAIFLIERIRKSIDEHCFDIGLQKIPLTISAGVAALDPEQDHLIDQLINNADRALYRAKGSGKNCVVANQADE